MIPSEFVDNTDISDYVLLTLNFSTDSVFASNEHNLEKKKMHV